MPHWLQWATAAAVFAVLAPLIAWRGKRVGARMRGGLALAALMLGFGEAMDPPAKHLIEATEDDAKGPPAPGEPPLEG